MDVERHPAPAAADVEHLEPGPERQLGDDMRLLVDLRLFQAVGRIGEIGAAILAVAIEEEIVELGRQIVMVRDVALRSPFLVEGAQPAERIAGKAHARFQAGIVAELLEPGVVRDDVEQVVDIAALDHQPPVHERLARRQ